MPLTATRPDTEQIEQVLAEGDRLVALVDQELAAMHSGLARLQALVDGEVTAR